MVHADKATTHLQGSLADIVVEITKLVIHFHQMQKKEFGSVLITPDVIEDAANCYLKEHPDEDAGNTITVTVDEKKLREMLGKEESDGADEGREK